MLDQGVDSTMIQSARSENTADRRVFTISSGYTVVFNDLTIRYGKADRGGGIYSGYNKSADITIEDGRVEYNRAAGGSWGEGGGIWAYLSGGSLTVLDTQIQNNQASGSSGSYGGAIYLRGEGTIRNSTINNNTVGVWGSGIYGYYPTLEITNSTFAYNTGWGAAVQGIFTGTLTITNSTIAYNDNNDLYGYATCGGVYLESGLTTNIKNTILAQNVGGNSTDCDWYRSGGTLSNKENNMVENQTGSDFTNGVSGNIVGVQANLNLDTSLASNGTLNQTPTLALQASSVAIDAGDTSVNGAISVPATDQRGASRNGHTDIGAYEYDGGGLITEYTLTYTAGAGGTLTGTTSQTAEEGNDGSAVTAVPDSGYVFVKWSDDVIDNPRTDTSVSGDITVDAEFEVESPPVISNISASSITSDSATITWTTDEVSSSQVDYGLVSTYGFQTSESDTSPRVTSHSVSLSSLKSCARYYYRVRSKDQYGTANVSSGKTFTTSGCTASSVETGNEENVSPAGGNVSLSHNSSTASITAPSGFYSENVSLQINKLNPSGTPSAPSNKELIDENFFDLIAVSDSDELVTTFDLSVTFTIEYGTSIESSYQEATLAIYKYDGSEWTDQSCSLDTADNIMTCTLSGFSVYALFGEPIALTPPTPTPTPTPEVVALTPTPTATPTPTPTVTPTPTPSASNTNSTSTENPTVTPSVCSYEVQSGDSLWFIAEEVYGDNYAYPQIITMNESKYPQIRQYLESGWVLEFDCEQDSDTNDDDTSTGQQAENNDFESENDNDNLVATNTPTPGERLTSEEISNWWWIIVLIIILGYGGYRMLRTK